MKAKTLGALGLGFGGGIAVATALMASGCFLPWMATARADDSYSYTCKGTEHELAQWDIGTDDPTEQARVMMVVTFAKPQPPSAAALKWQPPTTARIAAPSWNGSVAWSPCGASDAAGTTITFVRR
jgi:hypothetical protein